MAAAFTAGKATPVVAETAFFPLPPGIPTAPPRHEAQD